MISDQIALLSQILASNRVVCKDYLGIVDGSIVEVRLKIRPDSHFNSD
jgi:hypothetical protein